MKKNLILGIVDNYNYFRIERFFKSLAKTQFDGHVCLFIGPGTDASVSVNLKKAGVEMILYRNEFPYIENPHPLNLKTLPNPIHIWNFRHFLYYDYLLKNEGKFKNVMLSDIKDVIFQEDPFDFQINNKLYVAMERQSIADCEWTSKWIVNGYDDSVLNDIENQIVSCAGTTLGPVDRIKAYLHDLLVEIQQLKDAYTCADQAAHNVLLHSGKLDPVIKVNNESGLIMTVGSLDDVQFLFDNEGYLTNSAGKRVNIIHQADRRVELLKQLDKFIFEKPFYLAVAKTIYDKVRHLVKKG